MRRSFEASARELTPGFQQHLIDSGWPENVAKSMVLESKNGHIRVVPSSKDEADMQEALNKEFGVTGIAPMPALFTYFNDTEKSKERTRVTGKNLDWVVRFLNQVFA